MSDDSQTVNVKTVSQILQMSNFQLSVEKNKQVTEVNKLRGGHIQTTILVVLL